MNKRELHAETHAHEGKHGKPEGRVRAFLKRTGRRIGVFAASLPLLACFAGGCQDDCKSYNETTITLNRPVDGRTAPLKEVVKTSETGLMSEAAIDFLNEAVGATSGGMPADVKLTKIPQSCLDLHRSARVCEGSATTDRGVYLAKPVAVEGDENPRLATVAHEIGHLQESGMGNEVMSQINEREAVLMAYGLIFRNEPYLDPMVLWTGLNSGLEKRLYVETPAGLESSDSDYDRADVFIALNLVRLDGDFGAVRELAIRLMREQGAAAMLREWEGIFAGEYSAPDHASQMNRMADLALAVRIANFRELSRKFGLDAALSYFEANSARVVGPISGMAVGLDGYNCAVMDSFGLGYSGRRTVEPAVAAGMCPDFESVDFVQDIDEGARFCCIAPEVSGSDVSFRKFVLAVGGYQCEGSMGIEGATFRYQNHFTVSSSSEIGISGQCQ